MSNKAAYRASLPWTSIKRTVTCSNAGTVLSNTSDSFYVGTGGTLVVVLAGDTSDSTFANIPDGTLMPLHVKEVKAATDADDLLACYGDIV